MAMHFMLCFLTVRSACAPAHAFECWMLLGLHAMDQSSHSEPPDVLVPLSVLPKKVPLVVHWVGTVQDPSMTRCFQSKYLCLPYPSPQFATFFSVAILVCIAVLLSFFYGFGAFLPFQYNRKWGRFQEHPACLPVAMASLNLKTIYCVTPSKRSRNQGKCQTAAFRLYCINVIQEQANNSTVT